MPTKPKTSDIDPLDISGRTYRQIARLLDMLEDPDRDDEITFPQLLGALKLLVTYDLTAIRKFARDDEEEAGSAAHKFSKAFAQNAERGRARSERAKAALHVVAGLDDGDDGDPAA
jgi:hypothetical protein